MNKLWRFGDSYSVTQDWQYPEDPNHSNFVAKHFNLKLEHLGAGGLSILDCLTRMINITHLVQSNDMIILNLPSSSRASFLDSNGKLINSSQFQDDEILENEELKNVLFSDWYPILLRGYIHLLSSVLNSFIDRGARVFVFVNDSYDWKLDLPNKVRFNESKGWVTSVKEMGFEDLSPKGNLHYLYGVQEQFAQEIIKVIEDEENRRRTS